MYQQYLIVFLVSTVKFVFAFPLAAGFQLDFLSTLLVTIAGGITGVFFFAFISQEMIILWQWLRTKYFNKNKGDAEKNSNPSEIQRQGTPIHKKRRYIRWKQWGGLYGISILTPLILSIPLGTFLVVRFYGRSWYNMLMLCAAVVVWALIFCSLVYIVGITF